MTLGVRQTTWSLFAVAVASSPSCRGEAETGSASTTGSHDVTVLIDTSDDVLGIASDLIVGPDGTVYVVDIQASTVHVVDPSGDLLEPLGTEGGGPGEFSRPYTLAFLADTLAVVDHGNGRLQLFGNEGEVLSTRSLPPGQAPSLGSDGRFVVPSWGIDTALATIYDASLERRAGIGRIVGDPSNLVRPREMKEEIERGEVPRIFLNTARALVDADGATYLLVPARGTVERFDSTGAREWLLELDEAESARIFERFIAENALRPDRSFAPLSYIIDATLVDGALWLLIPGQGEEVAIRIVNRDGSLGARTEFRGVEGATQFAVDADRSRVYFVQHDRAALVWATIPTDF